MRECLKECKKKDKPCEETECRMWMDFSKDLNCCLYSIEENGKHTLDQVAKRLNMSLVNVFQIEKKALRKLKKRSKLGPFLKSDTN